MKNVMEHTNAYFIHCNLPSIECEMGYVDSGNISVAPSWTKNVADVNIAGRVFFMSMQVMLPLSTPRA